MRSLLKVGLVGAIWFSAIVEAQTTYSKFIAVTPTVSAASAYTAKDNVGSLMTFSGACLSRTNKAEVRSVLVTDKAVQGIDLELILFKTLPTTTFTDNAAFDPTDAELLTVTADIPIATHKAFNDNGVSYTASISDPIECDAEGKVYGVLITRGTPTYAATSDITVILEVFAD